MALNIVPVTEAQQVSHEMPDVGCLIMPDAELRLSQPQLPSVA